MTSKKQKTAAELKAELDLMMAKAALKNAVLTFKNRKREIPPEELLNYWKTMKPNDWKHHLDLFEVEMKKLKDLKIKSLFFDLDSYIDDVRSRSISFKRSRAEVLLMMSIGQIDVAEFTEMLDLLPSNREKLDRKIEKQIKELDWQDDQDLARLDELTERLEDPKIKKAEIEKIDAEIDGIEKTIHGRKAQRDALALRLVEWKARGSIDIAGNEGGFRLDA